jgi:hypothetical protein
MSATAQPRGFVAVGRLGKPYRFLMIEGAEIALNRMADL